MMDDMNGEERRLVQAREQRGFRTARAACDFHGWNYDTYIQHERGSRGISKKAALRYAKAYRVSTSWLLTGNNESTIKVSPVTIKGEVAAGVWLESGAENPSNGAALGVQIPDDPRYPLSAQYALTIRGDSVNKIASDGDIVVCLDILESGVSVENGDLVIVERIRDDGALHELTAKRYVVRGDKILLMPESTNPRFQGPLDYTENNGETDEIRIKAKVLWVLKKP